MGFFSCDYHCLNVSINKHGCVGDGYVIKSNKVKMQKIECGMDCKGKASSSKIMVFPAKRFLVERTDSIEVIINKHEKNDFETTVLILILDKKILIFPESICWKNKLLL